MVWKTNLTFIKFSSSGNEEVCWLFVKAFYVNYVVNNVYKYYVVEVKVLFEAIVQ